MNRVVRQCFLLEDDPVTGKNLQLGRTWTVRELQQFSACIGIDLLGFAVLSNHIHLIVRSRPNVVVTSDDTEVARRWLNIRWRVRMFDRTDLAGRAEYLVGDRRPLAELVF